MTHIVNFAPIPMAHDWQATRALSAGGPIILVQGQSADGNEFASRFDVQKAMFIDETPFKPAEGPARELVDAFTLSEHESGR